MLYTCYKAFSHRPHRGLVSLCAADLPPELVLTYRKDTFTWAPLGGIFTFRSLDALYAYHALLRRPSDQIWRCAAVGPVRAPLPRLAMQPHRIIPCDLDHAIRRWRLCVRFGPDEAAFRAVMPVERII